MGLKNYKPTSPALRYMTVSDFAEVTADKPGVKSLVTKLKRKGGRNNKGGITVRFTGGGHKRK